MAEETEQVGFPEIPDNLVDGDEAEAISRGPSFLKTPHMSSISFASSAHQEIKRPPFAEPEQDPYTKAIQYLEQHHIVELFQDLTEKLLLQRSDDPIKFLIEEVERQMRVEEDSMDEEADRAARVSSMIGEDLAVDPSTTSKFDLGADGAQASK